MNTFTKCFIGLTTFLLGFMLFLMLYRLANGRSAFIGLSDIYYYFQDVDFATPFNKLVNYLNSLVDDFKFDITNTSIFVGVDTSTIGGIWDGFVRFWEYLGNLFVDLLKFISFPFYATYLLIEFVCSLVSTFFNFLGKAIL